MKPLSELRNTLKLNPQEINSSIKYFNTVNIDFDVFLSSIGMNLQREYCWSFFQKRQLIWSILERRNIPRMAMMHVYSSESDEKGTYLVIDGKQRLSTMLDFINDKFTLRIDDKSYRHSELPKEYQKAIENYYFPYYIVHEYSYEYKFTDQDKIDWFMFINFAGTPQDKSHFDKLKKQG